MSLWALWDRAVPILACASAGAVGLSLGRAWERVEWLAGRRSSCGHEPACGDVRGTR